LYCCVQTDDDDAERALSAIAEILVLQMITSQLSVVCGALCRF